MGLPQHNVTLVRAKKMYGYHAEERLFMKISFYNPQHQNKIAALLQARNPKHQTISFLL